MDTMHNWVLWRSLLIALIVLPFIVAAILGGLLQHRSERQVDASSGSSRIGETIADETVTSSISGPGAWGVALNAGSEELHGGAATAVVDKQAA